MARKYNNTTTVSSGLHVTSRDVLDDRLYWDSLDDLVNFIENEDGHLVIHDGQEFVITSNPGGGPLDDNSYKKFMWMETPNGVLTKPFVYPGFQGAYSNKVYNLVHSSSSVVIKKSVKKGDSTIVIYEKELPLFARLSKVALVNMYEQTGVGAHDVEVMIPDSTVFAKNPLKDDEITLQINVKPAFEGSTTVIIKIS